MANMLFLGIDQSHMVLTRCWGTACCHLRCLQGKQLHASAKRCHNLLDQRSGKPASQAGSPKCHSATPVSISHVLGRKLGLHADDRPMLPLGQMA